MEICDPVSLTERTEFLQEGRDDIVRESPKQRRLRYAKLFGIILGTTMGPQNDGIAATWPNVFASDMETEQSTLFNASLHVSDSEMDLISSSYFIGTLPAIVFSGWLVSWLGRRRSMMLAAIPGVISWALIGLALNITMILTGRFICGIAHGLLGIAVRSYLAEVSDVKIRGAAGVSTESMKGFGGIAIIVLGIFVPWYYVAMFCGCHFLIYGALVVPLLPESPSYLIVKDREDDAIKVLRQLKGPYIDLKDMIRNLKNENERTDGSTGWRVLFKPDILKRYFIVAGLFFIGNMSGVEVIRGNATRMLQTSGLAFDRDISTVIVFVVLLSGNISQTLILDWIGRRMCLLMSLTLLLIAYSVLGTYIFLNSSDIEMMSLHTEGNMTISNDLRAAIENRWTWIPTATLLTAAFGCSLGIGPIPWLLSAEYFPTTIRPQVLAACSITANITTIAALLLYSPLQTLLTSAGLYWCYAIVAALGIIFTVVCVYETKGISIG